MVASVCLNPLHQLCISPFWILFRRQTQPVVQKSRKSKMSKNDLKHTEAITEAQMKWLKPT